MTTSERISELEKELSNLREQERTEREAAETKKKEEKEKELKAIRNAILAFNERFSEKYSLTHSNEVSLEDLIRIFCA